MDRGFTQHPHFYATGAVIYTHNTVIQDFVFIYLFIYYLNLSTQLVWHPKLVHSDQNLRTLDLKLVFRIISQSFLVFSVSSKLTHTEWVYSRSNI